MSHWTSYFDKVFLINLPHRTDRLQTATQELGNHNIPFTVVEAIKDADGRLGLYKTMIELFKICIERKYKRILVFEDDIKFLYSPDEKMDNVIKEITRFWDLLYLGCNATVEFKRKFSENLLYNERSFSSHAVGYSAFCMDYLLKEPIHLPYDEMLCNSIQKDGLSFCVNPILVTQIPNFSDIEKRYVSNYHIFLEDRFAEQTKNLNI